MKQNSELTYRLTESQVQHAAKRATTFRIYTERKDNLARIVARYFAGFSIIHVDGYWQGVREEGAVIEIVGAPTDLQTVVHLAGDIGYINAQSVVMVVWEGNRVDVPGIVPGI